MPLKVWNGSSWQVQAQLKVWNGSSWVSTNALNNAKSARVWNGSSWVQFHPGVRLNEYPSTGSGITLDGSDLTFAPTPASAFSEIGVFSGGSVNYVTTLGVLDTYTWLLTGSNSDYYAYMDAPSGDSFDGTSSATGTSLQLNSNRIWTLTANQATYGFLYKSLTSTLRIKNSAGTDILAIPVNMSALAEVQI